MTSAATTPAKTRVLVTGATGFLGRNILRALSRRPEIEPIAACRTPSKLVQFFGEVRGGNLLDAAYRRDVVRGVDIVCHAGTWGAFWGHERDERTRFFEPTMDLLEQSIVSGVGRFIQNSTVVMTAVTKAGAPVDDFAATRRSGFWPHLDMLIELDRWMLENSGRGTQMVTMRLGNFVGAGNDLGMVAALAPRLRTRLVPWLAGGRARMSLAADEDLGEAFALAAVATSLDNYESFNICGAEFPTAREVIEFIADETGFPAPWYSVPYSAGYAFAWLMEKLHPILPGSAPFLTRSVVHVTESWVCPTEYARARLGYVPRKDWRVAVSEALAELKLRGYPWPHLMQAT